MIDAYDEGEPTLQSRRLAAMDNALYNVMKEADGRQVLWALLHDPQFGGGLNRQSFAGENPLTTAFLAGKREVSLKLWDYMRRVDLGLVRIMEDEAIVRDNAQKGRT